jgi:hypothetical protein
LWKNGTRRWTNVERCLWGNNSHNVTDQIFELLRPFVLQLHHGHWS